MRAIVLDRFGVPSEVLTLRDAARPEPGAGEVRVRMKLAPINPSDLMSVRGLYGRLPTLPWTPGFEGMGTIDAVGPGWLARFRRLRPGRRVAVIAGDGGSWGEEVVVSARRVVPLADDISDEQGASFFVNPATALVMTRRVLQVPKGEWLLQTAAGSALGRMIVRLGKHAGFRTLNLVRSSRRADELRRLGADAVVALDAETPLERIDALTQGRKVGYALDCVGGDMGRIAVEALAPSGRMLVYGTLSGEPIALNPRALMTGQKSIAGFWLSDWAKAQHPLTMLGLFREITSLIRAGVLASPVEQTYALGDVAAAVAHAERPGRAGKILLRLA